MHGIRRRGIGQSFGGIDSRRTNRAIHTAASLISARNPRGSVRRNVIVVAEHRISVFASEYIYFSLSLSFSSPPSFSNPFPPFLSLLMIRTHTCIAQVRHKGLDKPRVSPARTSEIIRNTERAGQRGVSSVWSAAAARTAMYVVKIVYCQVTMEFVDRDIGTPR